ncbi:uncharacterized protein LOC143809004 [Ranitomeya variabilis]|uniref:uncharacterized protein LOC143809004 n=1 Tax=Ranitomeya variabilis TaxID=490064 RepID=UPI0040572C13
MANVINAVPEIRSDTNKLSTIAKWLTMDMLYEKEKDQEEQDGDVIPNLDSSILDTLLFRLNVINAVPAFRPGRFPTRVSKPPDLDTIIEEEEPDEDAADVMYVERFNEIIVWTFYITRYRNVIMEGVIYTAPCYFVFT